MTYAHTSKGPFTPRVMSVKITILASTPNDENIVYSKHVCAAFSYFQVDSDLLSVFYYSSVGKLLLKNINIPLFITVSQGCGVDSAVLLNLDIFQNNI